MDYSDKLGLGTVQWGMLYGIANSSGLPPASEVNAILRKASELGIKLLDTANAYGKAEMVIGDQYQLTKDFHIVTKTKPIQLADITDLDLSFVEVGFFESLKKLKSKEIYGLLAHNADNLLSKDGERLWKILQNLKNQRFVRKIGVSVYHPKQLEDILEHYEIDLVQLPFNIYDQRFAKTGLLSRLKQSGVEVHARSAFLQGLLLLSAEKLPEHFINIRKHHALLHQEFDVVGMSAVEACLSFCLKQPEIDKVLVGCETLEQLKEIIEVTNKSNSPLSALERYSLDDESIINPSRWEN